jgi:hypothetical protein
MYTKLGTLTLCNEKQHSKTHCTGSHIRISIRMLDKLPCPFNSNLFLFRHCAARGRLGCPHGAESADREQGGSDRSSQASRPQYGT